MRVKIITEAGNWICARLAHKLKDLPYVSIEKETHRSDTLIYYLPYLWYELALPVSKNTTLIGFFTHTIPGGHSVRYRQIAKAMDHCVVMADQYAHYLSAIVGSDKITKIQVPIDNGFKPRRLRVGWYSRNYPDGHKRSDWVSKLENECSSWLEVSKSGGSWNLQQVQESMIEQDVVLVTSKYEGGPLSLLEAMASGVPCVIGHDVGQASEFSKSPGVLTYDSNSYESMLMTLRGLYDARTASCNVVASFRDDQWIAMHDALFRKFLT
jgi:hypothetical protein